MADRRGRHTPMGLQQTFTLNKLECFTQAARPQRIRLAWDKHQTNRRRRRQKPRASWVSRAEGCGQALRFASAGRKHCCLPEGFVWLSWGSRDRSRATTEGGGGWDQLLGPPPSIPPPRGAGCLHASAGGGAKTGWGKRGAEARTHSDQDLPWGTGRPG